MVHQARLGRLHRDGQLPQQACWSGREVGVAQQLRHLHWTVWYETCVAQPTQVDGPGIFAVSPQLGACSSHT